MLLPFAGAVSAQQPAFEIASVKVTRHGPDADGSSRSDVSYRGKGRFEALNGSLLELIRYAWAVKAYQVIGPEWLDADDAGYDISAKSAADTTKAQARLMLQKLLADRFHLILHKETRIFPIYELKVAKKGLKIQPIASSESSGFSSGGGKLTATRASLPYFADWLSREAERPVVDRTAVNGAFDFTLQYAMKNDPNPEAPSLFTALQEQLGLKLESKKGPVEVLIIDHADKIPTDN